VALDPQQWRMQFSADLPSYFSLISKREKLTKICRKLQVIKGKITRIFYRNFCENVPVRVWSAHDHFVPLMIRVIDIDCYWLEIPSRLVPEIP